ncbi:MAG: hypothetical protein NZM18_05490 [Thermoflexales bacterium]|nr:hypothetical protein [Thermoflexales bacterium]MDW8318600.1 hypothetical protein [Anaerolineae bacterium]
MKTRLTGTLVSWLLLAAVLSGCFAGGRSGPGEDAPLLRGILTLSSREGVRDVDLSTGGVRPVSDFGLNATERNGLYIYVGEGGADRAGYALWRQDAQGRRPWLDVQGVAVPHQPRISLDGRYIAFDDLAYHPTTGAYGQYVLVYENQEPARYADAVRVIPGFKSPAWLPPTPDAPAGRLVLIGYEQPGIYLTDADLRSLTLLPWNESAYGEPYQAEPSPDGARLAVVTVSGSLYVADLDASQASLGKPRRVRSGTPSAQVLDPVWSPDGRWIAHLWGLEPRRDVVVSSALREAPPVALRTADGETLRGYAESQMSWRP